MSTIITRNSATSGSVPSSLVQGELAINVTNGRLFYGSGSGNIVKEFTGSASGTTVDTGSFVTTSSFNTYTGSNTSQFAGTASYATNALTASYAISASYEINYETSSSYADYAVSASHALNADNTISSSYALTASYATQALSSSYALNGGVTQLLAGSNITLSPTTGKGQVTISATAGGGPFYNTATGSYGSFYDTTTQTNPVGNIPRSMSFNTTDITNGVSISGSTSPYNTYIKTENPGVYDIQFSAQIDKTDSGTDEIVIWLRKNGSDLTDTATTITLNGNNDKQVAAWNWFVNSAANDYYQIIWYSADTNLRLLAETAGGGHPGIPSVILTVNRVDQFLSNTGSFSGSFTGQLIGTASFATSASWAPGGGNAFPYTGDAQISGSLGVTGSFSVLDSIDSANKILIGSGPIPGSTEDSVDWGSRTLFDTNGNFSVRWGLLRSMYDANASQSVDWNNRLLKFDNGPSDYTVDWNSGILQDTTARTSVDWQNRQLKDSGGNEILNWNSGIVITGSLRGQVAALSILLNTASVDMSTNNFFTLTLANGASTNINPTNINPGQTVNILVTQGFAGTGTVTFPSLVKQPSGSLYTGSAVANAVDIVTMIAFDSTNVYVSSVRNMI